MKFIWFKISSYISWLRPLWTCLSDCANYSFKVEAFDWQSPSNYIYVIHFNESPFSLLFKIIILKCLFHMFCIGNITRVCSLQYEFLKVVDIYSQTCFKRTFITLQNIYPLLSPLRRWCFVSVGLSVCLCISNTTLKVINRFWWNSQDSSAMTQGTIDWIVRVIWITIWIQDYFLKFWQCHMGFNELP